MLRGYDDRQKGAGTLEYVGAVVAIGVLVTTVALLFPSVGQQVRCKLSQAITGIAGRNETGCVAGSAGNQQAGSGSGGGEVPAGTKFSVRPLVDRPGAGTSRLSYEVEAPDGEGWKVTSDQPWAVVSGGDHDGSGSVTVVVNANPRQGDPGTSSRKATLTFTGPNGETMVQEIWQPGATAKTVVLGDSYSAGDATKRDAQVGGGGWDGNCERGSPSWATLLGTTPEADPSLLEDIGVGSTPSIGVDLTAYGACGGATVYGVPLKDDGYGTVHEGNGSSDTFLGQIEHNRDALAGADQVAFTLGGNDIGFSDIAQTCIIPQPDRVGACHDAVYEGSLRMWGADGGPSLDQGLEEAYRAALDAAPNATIYVVGYPHIIEPGDSSGGTFALQSGNIPEIVGLIDDLNSTIESTVNRVNASTPGGPRLVFVDPTAEGSPFIGHSIANGNLADFVLSGGEDSLSFFEDVDINWGWHIFEKPTKQGALHPNIFGEQAYSNLIGEYMYGDRPGGK